MSKPKIVVADDDRLQRQVIVDLVSDSYEVLTAADGAEAISLIDEHDDLVAVLSDHVMPEKTGVEVLSHVLDKHPDAVRILITATDDVKILEDSVNVARVHRFVVKPVRGVELPKMLAGAIREAQLERENERLIGELKEAVESLQAREQELEHELVLRTQELREVMDQLMDRK